MKRHSGVVLKLAELFIHCFFEGLDTFVGPRCDGVFRGRGEGLPDVSTRRRGDELVTVIVATPKTLPRRERELLQELGEELERSIGAHADGQSGKGWFGRIKDDITGDRA